MMKKLLTSVVLAGMLTGGAQAATFTFGGPYGGVVGVEKTYTSGSDSVTVTAGTYSHDALNAPGEFNRGDDFSDGWIVPGFGAQIVENGSIYGLSILTYYDDSHTVDGSGFPSYWGLGEMLQFDFGSVVELTDISLWSGSTGLIDVFVDGILRQLDVTEGVINTAGLVGQVFGFGANGFTVECSPSSQSQRRGGGKDKCVKVYDGFKISSISTTTTVIPVPAALPLLGAGLLGLGLLGRRRKSAVSA